jgi:hypothetical protein
MRRTLPVLGAVLVLSAAAPTAFGAFLLKDNDRVVFFGDRTINPASFSGQIELFIRIRYPALKTRLWHQSVRPKGTVADALSQFDERVAAHKPTIVVLCFGLDDPGREPFAEEKLAQFGRGYRGLIERCKTAGAQVWLVTPPAPDASQQARLGEIQFDQTVSKYADTVRAIAAEAEGGLPLVDWHKAITDFRPKAVENAKLQVTTRSGIDTTALGAALATELLLEAWQAEPMQTTIRADWQTGTAAVSSGSVTAQREGDEALVLDLKGIPFPWYIPNRGAILSEDWPPARFCKYTLQIDNVPDGGFIIGRRVGKATRNAKPFLSSMLRDGCDIGNIDPLPSGQGFVDFRKAVDRKNRSYDKVEGFRKQTAPEPEFADAYKTMQKAYEQYADGAARIIQRLPRTMDITLEIKTVRAAAAEAKKQQEQAKPPATTQPAVNVTPIPKPTQPRS